MNCGKRYKLYSFAPTNATWGIENRTVGFRMKSLGSESAHIENRMPGGGSNPYLVMAGVLAAGLDGLKNKIEPPAETKGIAYGLEGVTDLPTRLEQALDALEADTALRAALGEEFIKLFVAVKRHEIGKAKAAIADFDRPTSTTGWTSGSATNTLNSCNSHRQDDVLRRIYACPTNCPESQPRRPGDRSRAEGRSAPGALSLHRQRRRHARQDHARQFSAQSHHRRHRPDRAMQAMNMLDQLASVEEMGPVGEIRLMPDPDTFRVLPYAPHAAAMTVDMLEQDGTPWAGCPRSFLKRQIAACAQEASACKPRSRSNSAWRPGTPTGAIRPSTKRLCFSATGMTVSAKVIDDIIAAFEAQGMQVDQYYPELGHGQQEMPIRHAPALRAADNQVFYRETVRNVAYQHGLYASLAPKPWPDQAGNGAHIHFSLWDKAGKKNVMYDPERRIWPEPTGLSLHRGRAGTSARAAGADLPQLQLVSPPAAALLELGLHRLGTGQSRSRDSRAVEIQIRSVRHDERRTEVVRFVVESVSVAGRTAGSRAGRCQARADAGPGDADRSGNYTDAEREARGIQRFPTTLKEALDNLEKDQVLMNALGPLLAKSFLAVKRLEWESFSKEDVNFEIKHHFWKF